MAWGAALVVGSTWVQMHSIDALPVARAAFPSKRITLPSVQVERRASIQNVLIEAGMTLRRRHVRHRTVTPPSIMVGCAQQYLRIVGHPVVIGNRNLRTMDLIPTFLLS
jgi:hypothetical protein